MTPPARIPILSRPGLDHHPVTVSAARVNSRLRLTVLQSGHETFLDTIHALAPPIQTDRNTYTHLCLAGGGAIVLSRDEISRLLRAGHRLTDIVPHGNAPEDSWAPTL